LVSRPKPDNIAVKRMQKLEKISSKIHPVSTMNHQIYTLLWGRTKSGKTRFIGSGPNPITFAVEDGTMTIRSTNTQVFPVDEKGNWIRPRWQDALDFLYFLRYADHGYQTAGIDTATALARTAMRFVNKDEESRDEARAPGVNDQRTWGRLGTLMAEFMEDLEAICKERKMHLVYTCQERWVSEERRDQAGGADYVPDLTPSVRSLILAAPSIVARTVIEEGDEEGQEPEYKYGMVFRDADWPVGERVTPSGAKKPYLPRIGYNVTIPKLVARIAKASREDQADGPTE
jgi:AAA domain